METLKNGGYVLKRSFCVLSHEEYIDVHEKKKKQEKSSVFCRQM